jgi:hypothetical protein
LSALRGQLNRLKLGSRDGLTGSFFRNRLMWVNAVGVLQGHASFMAHVHSLPDKWLPISIAPSGVDLELCVMDSLGVHALVFPCHKNGKSWVDASTKKRIDVEPTHWRTWNENRKA